MNSYIFLDNVRFFAYHGVGQQEREVGNEFVIKLRWRYLLNCWNMFADVL